MSVAALARVASSSAITSAGSRAAVSSSSPWASRASATGPLRTSCAGSVLIPESSMRCWLAATSASSERFSGGIGSGVALGASGLGVRGGAGAPGSGSPAGAAGAAGVSRISS